MKIANPEIRSTALAALLSLPLVGGAALAQETDQADPTTTPAQDMTQQQSSQSATDSGQTGGEQQQDTVVATVGESEIRGSDVMTFIGMLPPQLQSQPPQMLVPLALEQLIFRELILGEARSQNLADDPEVVALVDGATVTAADDAMVQVWIDRETAGVVTDEAVQQAYDQAQSEGAQELPPLEEVRPQIEQYLRQQALQEIRTRLTEGADIVLYDPTGRPVEQQSSGAASSNASGSEATSGNASDTTSGGGQTGGDGTTTETSEDQSGQATGAASGDAGEQTQGN